MLLLHVPYYYMFHYIYYQLLNHQIKIACTSSMAGFGTLWSRGGAMQGALATLTAMHCSILNLVVRWMYSTRALGGCETSRETILSPCFCSETRREWSCDMIP
eukprot:SAG31_NODE_4511_length_3176_cov_5.171921_3_plen_103_part_00